MGKRKIIQILIAAPVDVPGATGYPIMYALCDDGSLWWKNESPNSGGWHRDDSIPQDGD